MGVTDLYKKSLYVYIYILKLITFRLSYKSLFFYDYPDKCTIKISVLSFVCFRTRVFGLWRGIAQCACILMQQLDNGGLYVLFDMLRWAKQDS